MVFVSSAEAIGATSRYAYAVMREVFLLILYFVVVND